MQKLESVLGVKAFEVRGRRAVLTPTGQFLYRRARALLDDARGLEQAARSLSAGWEAEIRVVMEHLFPSWLMLNCLARFAVEGPHTCIEVFESVLGGSQEALLRGEADIAVSATIPAGFSGDPLVRLRLLLAASPEHPLHQLGRPATLDDLRVHRQLVVRETGHSRATRASLDATQRWTVSHMSTSIIAARLGYGYALLPEERIRAELEAGTLKPIPLRDGGERYAELYLVYADRDAAGPGTLRLAEIIKEITVSECLQRQSAVEQGTR